jgi:hypothetical protein
MAGWSSAAEVLLFRFVRRMLPIGSIPASALCAAYFNRLTKNSRNEANLRLADSQCD